MTVAAAALAPAGVAGDRTAGVTQPWPTAGGVHPLPAASVAAALLVMAALPAAWAANGRARRVRLRRAAALGAAPPGHRPRRPARSPTALRRVWPGDRRAGQRTARLLETQLPLAADLLAACLGASGVPSDAAAAVARAVGPPMREQLAAAAAELRMGADPADCWERLGEDCPALAPLGRCLARAGLGGAPPAALLARLAQEQRSAAARAATARTRRAGVLATAPLGLCFLPAFVLVGIVPVVAGLATAFLGRA